MCGKKGQKNPSVALRNKLNPYWLGKKRPGMAADKNPSWKGGADRYCKRHAKERDDFTCQAILDSGKKCGFREPEIMEADHIIPKSECQDLQYVLENLITLCPNCHRRKTIREHKARIPWNKKAA